MADGRGMIAGWRTDGRDGTGREGRFTKKLARDVLVVLEVSQRASWMRCPNPNTKRSNLPILASFHP